MEQLILETICKCMRDKVIGSSQHGYKKGETCLTNLVAFYDEVTGMVDKQRAVDAVYLDFNKVYDAVSHCLSSQTNWWRAETSNPGV